MYTFTSARADGECACGGIWAKSRKNFPKTKHLTAVFWAISAKKCPLQHSARIPLSGSRMAAVPNPAGTVRTMHASIRAAVSRSRIGLRPREHDLGVGQGHAMMSIFTPSEDRRIFLKGERGKRGQTHFLVSPCGVSCVSKCVCPLFLINLYLDIIDNCPVSYDPKQLDLKYIDKLMVTKQPGDGARFKWELSIRGHPVYSWDVEFPIKPGRA